MKNFGLRRIFHLDKNKLIVKQPKKTQIRLKKIKTKMTK